MGVKIAQDSSCTEEAFFFKSKLFIFAESHIMDGYSPASRWCLVGKKENYRNPPIMFIDYSALFFPKPARKQLQSGNVASHVKNAVDFYMDMNMAHTKRVEISYWSDLNKVVNPNVVCSLVV